MLSGFMEQKVIKKQSVEKSYTQIHEEPEEVTMNLIVMPTH